MVKIKQSKMFIGLSLNQNWIFSAKFGKFLGLDEGDPFEVITLATKYVNRLIEGFDIETADRMQEDIYPLGFIQYGQSVHFLLNDPEIIRLIKEQTHPGFPLRPVYPFIHHMNDTHPECEDFFDTFSKYYKLTSEMHGNKILVHFHTKETDANIFQKTLDALMNPKLLDLIREYKIEIVLENNQHGSYFGYPKNIIKFFETLDKTLINKQYSDLVKFFNFCLDYGHMLINFKLKGIDPESGFKAFFDNFADRISEFHIHTNDGIDDLHLMPIRFDKLELLDEKGIYKKRDIDRNTKIIWRTLKYWIKSLSNPKEQIHILFEFLNPFLENQLILLGEKLGSCFVSSILT
ncbi:MAG: TIM barrel protein [Candidatus Lokiarchaeota archaeon]|nr:TIM barrel protein [Candidatus Lokiarchaeota archaeon]